MSESSQVVNSTVVAEALESDGSEKIGGGSFNGKTIQEIAAEVPEDGALVIEIANYINEDLTDYELHLPRGLEDKRAPKTISTRTKEVFTFKRDPGGYAPHGVLLYRIGNSGYSVHLFFWWNIIAIRYLGSGDPVMSLWPIDNLCKNYTQPQTPASMACINIPRDQDIARTLTIAFDTIYTKLIIDSRHLNNTMLLTMDVWKFEL
ncbi:unnamed protein product [Allacma fusca]|uniref:Uncharacterized protein n=1 Tax=Allacma fusca TaxID=39272 RepID=A0A8J2NW96_9HEXA|nr:unnamed protein product [Allacma fusca]